MKFFAHTVGKNIGEWQPLEDHLINTAQLTSKFAASFDAANVGYLAGLLHDLGKYSLEFQQRLRGGKVKVDHSTAGAQEVFNLYKVLGKVIAYAIAGHHCGLMDGGSLVDGSSLEGRLNKKSIPDYHYYQAELDLSNIRKPVFPIKQFPSGMGFSIQFFIRFIYSALVDADFLDTESIMNPKRYQFREHIYSLSKMMSVLNDFLNKIIKEAEDTYVNRIRQNILRECTEKAAFQPGFFTLTVPTGGGKTLSSFAFAVHHGIKFHKDRIIYVIPYTSIIEQNAAVFKNILGYDQVLEHHSNFFYPADESTENESEYDSSAINKLKLASENWDMPVIATTNIQFFESLFAARSSRCRKLHNIANSIIILDEAQMIPTAFLQPCINALVELVTNYNVSVLFCTATQPAIKKLLPKDTKVVEIIEHPDVLYQKLKRVKVEFVGAKQDDELTGEILRSRQVLCIVNSKKHARIIYEKIGSGNSFHLSTRMCPMHRTKTLIEIKEQLKKNECCRVVSTQLIEAGVDVDFPIVYRSSAGIDSIAQAAGRCNREGKNNKGQVYVFQPEKHGLPAGWLSRTAKIGEGIMKRYQDPLSLEAIKEYFIELYDIEGENMDRTDVMANIKELESTINFPFRSIAEKFKIIDQKRTTTIVIPWDEFCKKTLEEAEWSSFPGRYKRELQRYTVQVFEDEFQEMLELGMLKSVSNSFYVLKQEVFNSSYSRKTGLLPVTNSMLLNDTLII